MLKDAPRAISPQLAAEVIQTYLLPLFESGSRLTSDKQRSEAFGFTIAADSPTLYEELKLSTRLLAELKDSQVLAESLKKQLKDASEREHSALSEVNLHKEAALEAQTKLKFLTASQSTTTRSTQDRFLSTVFLASQLRQLQESLRREEEKNKQFSAMLQEERMKIDIRSQFPQSLTPQTNLGTTRPNWSTATPC